MRRAAFAGAIGVVVGVVAVSGAASSPAGAASERASARKALVTTADLPAGWTASAHESDGDASTEEDIARCARKPFVKKKVVVTGDDIIDPSDTFTVSSSVAVYRTVAAAKKQFALYRRPKFLTCAKKQFETTPFGGAGGPLPSSVDVGTISLAPYGDRTVGYGFQADVPDRGATTTEVTVVEAAVLEGRAIARYQFAGNGEIFDEATGEAVLGRVHTRLQAAKL